MSRAAVALAALEPEIRDRAAEWSVPGLTVGILIEGEVATAAFGVANVESGQPVVPETLFQIGSISKIFTTTLVMSLVDEGLIDLDRPIIDYLPDLRLLDPVANSTITMRHLLTHTGGFYGDRFDDHGNGDDALARAVAAFGDLRQQTAPGELWTYCNAGFDLAGRVVEEMTGMPFEHAMRTRVFEPLDLKRATYFAADAIRHSVAVGHLRADDGSTPVAEPWPIPRRSNSAGGVTTNAQELLRFARMHLDGGSLDGRRVISSNSAGAMREPQTAADWGRSWGLGWSLSEMGGTRVLGHAGATTGFTSRLTLIPEREFALAVLTNGEYGGSAHTRITAIALEQILGLSDARYAQVALTPTELSRFAGHYRQDALEIWITVESTGLRLERVEHNSISGMSTSKPSARMEPIAADVFEVVDGDLRGSFAEFIPAPDGSIRFLRIGADLTHPVTN